MEPELDNKQPHEETEGLGTDVLAKVRFRGLGARFWQRLCDRSSHQAPVPAAPLPAVCHLGDWQSFDPDNCHGKAGRRAGNGKRHIRWVIINHFKGWRKGCI